MSKYKVAFIDESDIDIRKFQRFARNYFEVIPIKPSKEKEATASTILESHVDAIIVDFDLSEQDASIHYNGADLVSLILEERELFPVFILTSYEDDAVSKGEDVNIVYEKSEMVNGEKFLERVKAQIEKYYFKLEESEKRLLALIEESKKRKLDALEEDEIMKLDSLIEKALDKKSPLPNKIRKATESSDLSELLKKVDELANKLDKK
ncbi:MAG: hypothetical protein IPJ03_09670 [Ignavibacteriales bacterium]|nr:hypothetical protein [Ignavibacteriales bacterium]